MTKGNDRASVSSRSVYDVAGGRVVAFGMDVVLLTMLSSALIDVSPVGNLTLPLIALPYFAALPATPLEGTFGKFVLRIKLTDRNGEKLGWRAASIRATAMLFWLAIPFLLEALGRHSPGIRWVSGAWWPIFLLPWATSAFSARRESAFDLIAGSVVVARAARPESMAADARRARPSRLKGIAVVIGCLVSGYWMQMTMEVVNVRIFRARTSYAIQAVQNLKARVVEFRAQNDRWPSSQDLGVPDWNPYPDGGGYRLKQDGSIEIEFTVLPELKGRRIVFVPRMAPDGQSVNWVCSTDGGMNPQYVPVICR